MPVPQAKKMRTALEAIAMDKDNNFDIKKLKGMEGYRLRIGQYRAVYTIDMVIMNVDNIAPRGSIY